MGNMSNDVTYIDTAESVTELIVAVDKEALPSYAWAQYIKEY